MCGMNRDNPFGADNQQETKVTTQRLDSSWVVGFVDGEGCFSVAIHSNPRNARRTRGWQLTATFQVSQHEAERAMLERFHTHLGCGHVYHKGPGGSVMTSSVIRLADLAERIISLFEQHRLLVKDEDFPIFATIVRLLRVKEHLRPDGFDRVVRLAFSMNAHGRQRAWPIEDILQGSSETVRQARR